MKYLFTFLLIAILLGCSNPTERAVENIGSQVKKCCTSFSVDKMQTNPIVRSAPKQRRHPYLPYLLQCLK